MINAASGTPLAKVIVPLAKVIVRGAGPLVALLVFSAGLGYWNTLQLRRNYTRIAHTDEVLDAVEGVVSTMKDTETSQRGYLLTGVDSYLAPYNAAVAAVQDRVQRLKGLTNDNPRQQVRIRLMEEKISAKLKELDRAIALRKKDPETGWQIVLSGEDQRLMDAVRARSRKCNKKNGTCSSPENDNPLKVTG